MDQKVLMTQVWLNNTYSRRSGYIHCDEDGATGNGTVASLISALQLEIGISSPTGEFGPATAAACPTLNSSSTGNIVKILQGALWCKGFSSADLTGKFDIDTISGVNMFEMAAGFSGNSTVTPKIFKGLLSTDAVVLISGGDSRIRQIQQALNRSYSDYFWKDLNICPCDGVYGRNTCNALLYAFQAAVGIDEPNGVFGPGTAAQAGEHNVALGSGQTELVYLLQYLLYVNGYNPGSFDGNFDPEVKTAVMGFQGEYALDADGYVGLSTWAALLVSKGNINRSFNAIDCTARITYERASYLKSIGINYVGRYLTGYWRVSKVEIQNMNLAGLKFIPIFQRSGGEAIPLPDVTTAGYFDYYQGISDGNDAVARASALGLPSGSTIYFAVDFDVYDYEVSSHILPYFRGVHQRIGTYNVGIYAPRYACTAVTNAGYASKSYVSDMSTAYSGNIGQRIPSNWAFDQFYETSIGSGSLSMGIDQVIASGRDSGTTPTISGDIRQIACSEVLSNFQVQPQVNWNWNQEYFIMGLDFNLAYKFGLEGQFTPMLNPNSIPNDQKVTLSITNGVYDKATLTSAENLYKELDQNIQASLGSDGFLTAAVTFANNINKGNITISFSINNGYPSINFMIEQYIHTSAMNEEKVYTEVRLMPNLSRYQPKPNVNGALVALTIASCALMVAFFPASVAITASTFGTILDNLLVNLATLTQ